MGPQLEWLAAARQIAQAFDSRLQITVAPLEERRRRDLQLLADGLGRHPSASKRKMRARWARLCSSVLMCNQPCRAMRSEGVKAKGRRSDHAHNQALTLDAQYIVIGR
jgi:hypothetical protein